MSEHFEKVSCVQKKDIRHDTLLGVTSETTYILFNNYTLFTIIINVSEYSLIFLMCVLSYIMCTYRRMYKYLNIPFCRLEN